MNSAYDLKESADLISKLLVLTRDGKVEWRKESLLVKTIVPVTTRFLAPLDGDSEAQVWLTSTSAGFKLAEKTREPGIFVTVTERDLISISIDHEDGPSSGQIYIDLMSLLELARRSADKIEPKIDRVKQFLDKLAV